jgi:hypothetical protein
VVGDMLVHKGRGQMRDGRYPFVLFPWLPRDRMFMCEAWVSSMVDPQIAYNEGKAHAYTWLNRASNPNLLAPQNSGIREQVAWNFHTLYYQPGFGDVKLLQPQPLSPTVLAMMEDSLQDIDRCSNQGPFLRGDPVPGVPAASYARMMAAAAASHLGQFNADWSEAWAELGTGLLMLEREYGKEDELAVIVGKSNRPAVIALKRSDLDDNIPIVVTESSLQVKLADARQEMMMGLINAGVYNPAVVPEDLRSKLLAFIDMPDLNEIEDGTTMLTTFAKGAVSRIVDEREELHVPPPLMDEPVVLGALKDECVRRSVGEDVWQWSPETMGMVIAFKGECMQALQALQEQMQAEQMKQQGDQLGLMAEGEKVKSDLRQKEKLGSIVAQVGADAIVEAHMPPKQSSGDGAEGGKGAG